MHATSFLQSNNYHNVLYTFFLYFKFSTKKNPKIYSLDKLPIQRIMAFYFLYWLHQPEYQLAPAVSHDIIADTVVTKTKKAIILYIYIKFRNDEKTITYSNECYILVLKKTYCFGHTYVQEEQCKTYPYCNQIIFFFRG